MRVLLLAGLLLACGTDHAARIDSLASSLAAERGMDAACVRRALAAPCTGPVDGCLTGCPRGDAEQARRDADWAAHPELTAQLACVAWCERNHDAENQWVCGDDCRHPPPRFYPDAGR